MRTINCKPGDRVSGKVAEKGIEIPIPTVAEALTIFGEAWVTSRFERGYRIRFNENMRPETRGDTVTVADVIEMATLDHAAFFEWLGRSKPRGKPAKPPTIVAPLNADGTVDVEELQRRNPNLKIVTA